MQIKLPQAKSGVQPTKACEGCGECCKRLPGSYWPEDFSSITSETLVELFKNKAIAVDWWEGDPRATPDNNTVNIAYFLRPRTVGRQFDDDPRHASWGGQCVNLQPDGCKLTFENRPKGCRDLVPGKNRGADCVYPGGINGKQEAAIAWLPYTAAIEAALEKMV